MSTLERAIEIAAQAHAGQVDKAGQPYILHPLRVMLMVKTRSEQMAAVLHDVVEDTTWTFEDLAAEGFADEVIEAIRALTKSEGEKRLVAAKRAAQNSIARNVKLGDVYDNMNLARIAQPTEKDLARLEEYKQVRAVLVEHGATLAVDRASHRD
jgi:(p)ppGpp synthase/HD superfamily hydrolase